MLTSKVRYMDMREAERRAGQEKRHRRGPATEAEANVRHACTESGDKLFRAAGVRAGNRLIVQEEDK